MKSPEEIKQIVNEKYSQIARDSSQKKSYCCRDDSVKSSNYTNISKYYSGLEGYNKEADLGLGCGIPTAYARIKKGDTVVDLGSGAGNDCFIARAEVGPEGRVIGIDMSADMIEKARQNALRSGFKNVEFKLGEIESLPLDNETVDVVISNCVLNLVPDKKKTMQEIFRVIKPGGHFCVSDITLKKSLPAKIREQAEWYVGCVSGAVLIEEYLNHIHAAGFRNIEILQEKAVDLPDDLLKEYLDEKELADFKNKDSGIFSITVYAEKPVLNPVLNNYVSTLEKEFQLIAPERVIALNRLGDYILEDRKRGDQVRLVFICTHNSGRSHFAQAWTATAAYFYGFDDMVTWSGGMESTAFNPAAVEAFKRAGFKISVLDKNNGNPKYALAGSDHFVTQPMYSKKFDDPLNPDSDFTAVMVCSHADEACPFVPGASARFAITYDDPKKFDGTAQESEKYDERCRQIAREIFYLMNYVRSNL